MQTEEKPRIPYWHLWTDADGVSHQTRCLVTEFELQSISGPAQPQWQGHRTKAEVTVMRRCFPSVGPVNGMRIRSPNGSFPCPAAGLSSPWMGSASKWDPVRSRSEPTRTRGKWAGRKGHLSGVVGDEPAVLLLIQFENAPPGASPCLFR
jgi:hypothetical protein